MESKLEVMSLNLDFHNSPLILVKYYTCWVSLIKGDKFEPTGE
jgi:hypothetical protein